MNQAVSMEGPGLMVRPGMESMNSPFGPTVSRIVLNSGFMKSRRSSLMDSSICFVSISSSIASRMRAAVSISIMPVSYTHLDRLKSIYEEYDSLEDALSASPYPNPVTKIQDIFSGIEGIPVLTGTSACKRLAMFLRWMVRKDGIVDLDVYKRQYSERAAAIKNEEKKHKTTPSTRLIHAVF